jgi:C4-dicarboxylate transporter/malic acid transport protein
MQNSSLVRSFAPGWFASVMGTAVAVIALQVFRSYIPFVDALQLFFLGLAFVMFVLALIPWTLRWFLHPDAALTDLRNPVSGAFFPTMPISLLVGGIALEKVGPRFLPEAVLPPLLQGLWLLGAAGILVFAVIILNNFFHHPEMKWETATLGWLIPPVSALLVPVLGSSLANSLAGTFWGELDLIVSLVFLGFGGLLFLFVMAVAFNRYIFHPLPAAHLAPTLWIGLAPSSILAVGLIRIVVPLGKFLGAEDAAVKTLSLLASGMGVALWGFAFFWLILTLAVTISVHKKTAIPFALSWWAFVFPSGAFVVASGVVFQAVPSGLILWTGLAALLGYFVLWAWVFALTLRGLGNGSLLQPHIAK